MLRISLTVERGSVSLPCAMGGVSIPGSSMIHGKIRQQNTPANTPALPLKVSLRREIDDKKYNVFLPLLGGLPPRR